MIAMIIDCHVHASGRERVDDVLKAIEEAGLDGIVLFSPYPGRSPVGGSSYPDVTEEGQIESMKFISRLQAEAPDRIIGFLWLEPRLRNAARLAERAVTDFELRGIKMIPDHWYPYEERFFPLYEKIGELGVPIIFHSGILWGFRDSSRFCRPVYYEVLLNFPKVRFALAHIGWPWVDECIAVWGRFRADAERREADRLQMFIDTTPGTPRIYRREALHKALAYGAEDYMLFGSDSRAGDSSYRIRVMEADRAILREEIGVPASVERKFFGMNAKTFLDL